MLPRCTIALIVGFFLLKDIQAQDSLLHQRITIPETICSIDEALKIVEKTTGLSFSYNSGLIDKRKIITLKADQEELISVLYRIFGDASLQFSVLGRHLAVYRPYRVPSADPSRINDSVNLYVISGQVMARDTRQPLPFSSVYLDGKPTGTISNEEGEFRLKLDAAKMHDTLIISCMGYKNFISPVSALINSNRSYFLVPDIIPIQEVIIRKVSPVILLQEAVREIRNNYPADPALLTSFYRETVQRGNRFTMVSEAILENYKTGYQSNAADRVKIIKGRKNENLTREDSVILKLKAGLNTMLMLDVVKNIPDFLTGESLADYRYRLTDIVVEDGRDNYAVEFTPLETSPEHSFYSGRIIIDINDMAFKWVEFQVDPANLELATERFIVRKPANVKVKTLKASYKVGYRKFGDKYYLHTIACETGFRVRNRRQFSGSVYNTKLETVVTAIDTVNVNRFSLRESARQFDIFTEQLGTGDESYWGEYNYIAPEESLENALKKLVRDSQ